MVAWLYTYFGTPRFFYLQYLLVSPGPDSPEYQARVASVLPYMDLLTTTFIYSLLGSGTSFPYLLSASHVEWMRSRWSWLGTGNGTASGTGTGTAGHSHTHSAVKSPETV